VPSSSHSCNGSLQRYLLALLTAVHQHNSGAASRSQQEGDGASDGSGSGAVAAAVAPLVAALGGRQLRLSAAPGASDVAVTAGA